MCVAGDRSFQSHYWITPSSAGSGTFTFSSSSSAAGLPYAIDPDTAKPRRIKAPFAVQTHPHSLALLANHIQAADTLSETVPRCVAAPLLLHISSGKAASVGAIRTLVPRKAQECLQPLEQSQFVPPLE